MYKKNFHLSSLLMNAIILSIIAVGLVFAYWGIQNHQFLNFDDNMYVQTNDFIRNGISLENIKWAFSFNGEAYWHPLTWLSLMLDCHIFGLKPGPLLIENVLFHMLNAFFLYLILTKMSGARYKSAFVALLFAIHPINVESVAWIVERKTVLSAFFLMTGIYTYIIYAEKQKKWLYGLVVCLYAVGLMAKPVILVFPFLLLVLDYWPLKRFTQLSDHKTVGQGNSMKLNHKIIYFCKSVNGRIVLEKIPFVVLSIFSLMISMYSLLIYETVINYESVPVYLRVSNFFISIVQYLRNILWPVQLSIIYPFPQSIPVWHFLLALIFVVVVTLLIFYMRKERPWLIAGWCWFLIALMPASGLIQSGIWPAIANRFMYLPVIGFLIMFVWEVDERLKGRYSNILKAIICVTMICYFAFLTRVQNIYFTNSYSLFHRSLEIAEDNSLALNNISVTLTDLGRHDEAMKYLERGIKLYPHKAGYYQNYGVCLVAKGDDLNAIAYFKKAIELDPKLYGSYQNIGIIQSRRGYEDEALKLLEKAIEINPINLNLRNSYGTILGKNGKYKEALSQFSYVIKKDPSNIQARINLAQTYQDIGRFDDAMKEYEFLNQTVKKNKGYIYYGMAGIYSEQQKHKECLLYLEMAQKNQFNVSDVLKVDKRFKKFKTTHFYEALLIKLKVSGNE